MSSFQAVYKIPRLKQAFFIMSEHQPARISESIREEESIMRMEYIRNCLNHHIQKICPRKIRWTIKAVSTDNFLQLLDLRNRVKGKYLTPLNNPENLALLTINKVTTSKKYQTHEFHTEKSLGFISDKDILEVFI